MLVLARKPAVAKRIEVRETPGPEFVDNPAAIIAKRPAIWSGYSDLFRSETVLGQRSQRRHQMDVRIARRVVKNPVSHHALGRDASCYEVPDEFDVLLGGKLYRQCDRYVLGKLRVRSLLEILDLVPEGFRCVGDRSIDNQRLQPFRCITGNDKFLMQQPLLARIIDRPGFPLVVHFGAVPIRRRQHGAAAGAARNNAD